MSYIIEVDNLTINPLFSDFNISIPENSFVTMTEIARPCKNKFIHFHALHLQVNWHKMLLYNGIRRGMPVSKGCLL